MVTAPMRGLATALVALAVAARDGAASSIYDVKLKALLSDEETPMSEFRGKVLLIANVASECGFTNDGYAGLNALYRRYKDDGLQVLGMPCNQFGNQEPGKPKEIREFADSKGATWPIFAKANVNDPDEHPLYTFLKQPPFDGHIGWNFEYFLVSREGKVVARWKTDKTAELNNRAITKQIERELRRGGGGGKAKKGDASSSAGGAEPAAAESGLTSDDAMLLVVVVVVLGTVAFVVSRRGGPTKKAKGGPPAKIKKTN